MVALLSGGTGGAKLARGLLDVADELAVIANTGDDVEIHGVHVSPDPDLISYWLADRIDAERGYGLRGDTFERIPSDHWFRLGDHDLTLCARRTERLHAGDRLTDAHRAVTDALALGTRVLPMSDDRVETRVKARGRWFPFQEFMILEQAAGPIDDVEFRGVESARPTQDALEAIRTADVIVIGPSNPVISIGPILAVPGTRDAIAAADAAVVAVSPFVAGHAVKGPTDQFCAWAGIELSADGIARYYGDLLDGLVADEPGSVVPILETQTLMDTPDARRRLAAATLDFAVSLKG